MKAFVVRLWTSSDEVEGHAQDASELCGVVEQVGSDEPTPFRSGTELLGLLRWRALDEVGQAEGRREGGRR